MLAQIYAQDYPGRVEVVIMDDSDESSEASIAEFAEAASMDVHYQFLPERTTIGKKRNMAAASTSADIICTWDDDDVFTSDRISRQVHALLADDEKDCSYAECKYFFKFKRNQLNIGLYTMDTPQENALCFWRSWFEEGPGFLDASWGEGRPLYRRGAWQMEGVSTQGWKLDRFVQLPGVDLPVLYVKHPNSATGELVSNSEVRCYEDPPLIDGDLLSLARALRQGRYPELPMPTYASVLRGTRAAVFDEITKDVKRLRSSASPETAGSYLQMLGGSGEGGTVPDSFEEILSSIEATQRELLLR